MPLVLFANRILTVVGDRVNAMEAWSLAVCLSYKDFTCCMCFQPSADFGSKFERAQARFLIVDVAGDHQFVRMEILNHGLQAILNGFCRADDGIFERTANGEFLRRIPVGVYVVDGRQNLSRCSTMKIGEGLLQ